MISILRGSQLIEEANQGLVHPVLKSLTSNNIHVNHPVDYCIDWQHYSEDKSIIEASGFLLVSYNDATQSYCLSAIYFELYNQDAAKSDYEQEQIYNQYCSKFYYQMYRCLAATFFDLSLLEVHIPTKYAEDTMLTGDWQYHDMQPSTHEKGHIIAHLDLDHIHRLTNDNENNMPNSEEMHDLTNIVCNDKNIL